MKRQTMISERASYLAEIDAERIRQDEKWGEQNHPDGTSLAFKHRSARAREACDQAHRAGVGSWRHILTEEFYEACAEEDPVKLREELVQVAAVAVAWIEAIDRRMAGTQQ